MRLVNRIIQSQIRKANIGNLSRFNDGNLHVVLVGTNGPLNRKNRGACTCTAIIAGKKMFLFDSD